MLEGVLYYKPLLDKVIQRHREVVPSNVSASIAGRVSPSYTCFHAHFFGASGWKKAEIKRFPSLLKDRVKFERIWMTAEAIEILRVSSEIKNSTHQVGSTKKIKDPMSNFFSLWNEKKSTLQLSMHFLGFHFFFLWNPQFVEMASAINQAPKG